MLNRQLILEPSRRRRLDRNRPRIGTHLGRVPIVKQAILNKDNLIYRVVSMAPEAPIELVKIKTPVKASADTNNNTTRDQVSHNSN